MSGRIVKAALAGAGALALLGAGTTYAAFSDSKVVEAARVSASTFSVGAASASGGGGALVPGDETGVSQTFLVTNSSSTRARIGVSLANLVDREDGCSADEVEVDPDCNSNIGKRGDLSNQALVKAVAFPAVAGSGVEARCPVASAAKGTAGVPVGPVPNGPVTTDTTTTVGGPTPSKTTSTSTDTYVAPPTSLAAFVNGPRYFDFSELAPIEAKAATCVRMTLTLPLRDDNNAVQGDTVNFDVRLRLSQVVSGS